MKKHLTPIHWYVKRALPLMNSIKHKSFTLFLAFLLLVSFESSASHFRYGLVTATRLSETGTTVTYRINVSEAWRLTAASSSSSFTISGGNSGGFTVPMTTVTDPSGGWSNNTGTYVLTLNKTTTPTRIEFTSCCKISNTINNHDMNWDEYIILNTNAPGSSPVSTLPAIINMPINAASATYSIPASDPDPGSTLTYGVPNFASGPLAGQSEPSGFSVNSSTGQITLNTIGKTVGQLYNAMVTVTDNDGNQVMLDFIINMVGASNPPVFDYTTTPTNGAVYNVIAGQNISFPIKATDADPGSTVSLSVSGLPAYITVANFSPAFPATGNPSTTTFSWTPAIAQIGTTNILNLIASDNVGVQTTTSVTIKVVAEPAPVFISPTPGELTIRQIMTGVPFSDVIRAQSSLGSNVSVAFATVPAGSSLSPSVPTSGSNPGQTTLSWTPTPASFGTHNLSFQAVISSTPTIFATRNYSLIVNTPPQFSSTPASLNVNAGQPFSYNITINDPDIPYGDVIDIVGATLPSWLTLTSTGNGTATLSGTPTMADGGLNTVDLEAEDIYHHGNPAHVEQSFDINVITCVAPAISGCPQTQYQQIYADANACSKAFSYALATSGTSPDITYTFTGATTGTGTGTGTGSTFNVGQTTVVIKAVNDCGSAICSFVVTVIDNVAPVAKAKNITVYLNASGQASITPQDIDDGSSDNCGGVSLSFNSGIICGVATENQSATLTAPAGTTITSIDFASYGTPTGSCGNFSTGWCHAANSIAKVSPYLIGHNSGVVPATNGLFGDPCYGTVKRLYIQARYGGSPQGNTFNCSNLGNNAVSLLVTDANGNVSVANVIVTVKDNMVPTIICPADVHTFATSASGALVSYPQPGVSDNCATTTTMTAGLPSGTTFPIGTTTVTHKAADASGNAAECSFEVIVVGLPPVIVVPADITISNDPGQCGANVSYSATETNAIPASTITYSIAPGSFFTVGTHTVTATATNAVGTSSGTFTVTVEDNQLPNVITQSVTIQLDASGNASTTASAVDNGSNDACGVASVSLSKTSFNCSDVGANTVTLSVTDVNGNSNSASALVTVEDHIAPNVATQPVTIQLDASGSASVTASQVNNGSSDACGIATMTLDNGSFNCTNVGPNTVTLTVTDVHGNSNSATAVVTVQDNIAPTVLTQNMNIQLDASGNASITASQIDNGSSDNCSIAGISIGKSNFNCSNVGANTVTLTVTDVNGNVNTATAIVNVSDVTPPVVHTQNVSVTISGGSASITATQINNVSTDACGIATVTVSPSTFNCSNIGNNTVTLTVTDVNGNVSTGTATVTVNGVVPSCSIASTPSGTIIGSSTTYAATNQMYLGYGKQSMTLNVTASGAGPFTYSWNGSNLSTTSGATTVFTPTAGGTYTFICTSTNSYGCQTTCAITICVIDARDPNSNANNPKVIICHLPPGNPNNRQTLSVGISAVPAHVGQHGGDKLGSCNAVCGYAKSDEIGDVISEETILGEVDLIVFPNPSRDQFTLRLESPSDEPMSVTIYDMQGRVIEQLDGISPKEPAMIGANYQVGIYIAEVKQGEFHRTVKINKNN